MLKEENKLFLRNLNRVTEYKFNTLKYDIWVKLLSLKNKLDKQLEDNK